MIQEKIKIANRDQFAVVTPQRGNILRCWKAANSSFAPDEDYIVTHVVHPCKQSPIGGDASATAEINGKSVKRCSWFDAEMWLIPANAAPPVVDFDEYCASLTASDVLIEMAFSDFSIFTIVGLYGE